MELLRKRDNPAYKYTIATMGYGLRARTKKQKYSYSTSSLQSGRVHSQSDTGTPSY
ncbi:hypothetical protein MKW98_024744 [Papaver atlanticum]|uniref:Uncharacterized protein n=1 Tax=Papaver atlanticum TaxID=357466 RepID=A0AAD4T855_9MAGN|nr:hypothetical protein MKW98_024744 [Papaver atlanticum]